MTADPLAGADMAGRWCVSKVHQRLRQLLIIFGIVSQSDYEVVPSLAHFKRVYAASQIADVISRGQPTSLSDALRQV